MNRLIPAIITRTGDSGTTGLADGSRVSKCHQRIDALGNIDELNAAIGVLRSEPLPEQVTNWIELLQHDLFTLGAELAKGGSNISAINTNQVEMLEQQAAEWDANIPPMQHFILPGGTKTAALAHLARTICRRAERSVLILGETEKVSEQVERYLNRLSDVLFILARYLNYETGVADIAWKKTTK